MNLQDTSYCPKCHSTETVPFKKYDTVNNGLRSIFKCNECNVAFSETTSTPMEHLKSPISKVASVQRIRSEGVGLRATGRILGIHKNTVSTWEQLFADQKETLMLYSFCHEFVSLVFEGDELYTIVNKRTDPSASEGWTAVIMERSSRFIVEQQCGPKNADLFESVMATVCEYIDQTNDIAFFSDGERRYGTASRDARPKCFLLALKSESKTKGIRNINVA